MPNSTTKKNRVNLKDYDYKHDIKQRVIMSKFNVFDIEVLEEILNSSLKFHISELTDYLETNITSLLPVLEKLKASGLLKCDDHYNISVDKNMRKYYEFQLSKFDGDFKPDMDFLQKLLHKVPIQVLPSWYMIPRTSDNIFQSILDKYFITPQVYERYIQELKFNDPILNGIVEDVFDSPNLSIRSREIREKYYISRSEFEEYMLQLEFNFACCLSYSYIEEENTWSEIITPFHEWRQYLLFKKNNKPQEIEDVKSIKQYHETTFAFANDCKAILNIIKKNPLKLSSPESFVKQVPSSDAIKTIKQKLDKNSKKQDIHYFSYIISKLCALSLAENNEGLLVPCSDVDTWLEMDNEDFSMHVYKHPLNIIIKADINSHLCRQQHFREIEKGLRNIPADKWFLCSDFLKSLTESIGESRAVSLKKVGRHWQYAIPQYSDEEKQFITAALKENLFEAGLIDVGIYKGENCFRITAFGQIILEI
jgi:hypothetical protein